MSITEDNLTGLNTGPLYPNAPLRYLTASSIIGDKVHSREDESLGHIKDIMIDLGTGKIDYYVLEYGGLLGLGSKYFALPAGLLKVDEERKLFVFDQPKERFEKAPGFNDWHWPDTNIHLEHVGAYWNFMG